MSDRLNFTSYIVLALVGDGGAGAHDIARAIRLGGQIYGGVAASQIYAETKRLEALDLLESRLEPGQTGERRVYSLSEKGRGALCAYLEQPSPFPTLRQEVTLRLLAGDLIGPEAVRRSVLAMRADIDRMAAQVAEMEARVESLPHRKIYLQLQHDLGRRLIETYRAWVVDVASALAQD